MQIAADKYQNELKDIKEAVTESYEYMQPNFKRFHAFRSFTFATSISESERAFLTEMQYPQIEFNVGEAYISRLAGEFSKQEPSIEVSGDPDSVEPVNPQLVTAIEGHMRHVFNEARKDNVVYEGYKDVISGGFAVLRLWTEYSSPNSFAQVIKFAKERDPTLCGFDPMAQTPTKHDGEYFYRVMPMRRKVIEKEFKGIDLSNINRNNSVEGFKWGFNTVKTGEILMLCEFYKKKYKRYRIVHLADGSVVDVDDYKMVVERWSETGRIEQPPAVIGEPRWTTKEIICRYMVMGNQVLSYTETPLSGFPLVYCPGNDAVLRKGDQDCAQLMTRPYLYHYADAQRLKNYAGQCLAAELQNMVQHKIMVQKEALPTDDQSLQAYKNFQRASVLVHNAYDQQNKPLASPVLIQRPPIPPEISNTFMATDSTIQAILGSYDAQLGINDSQLSGVAIVEGATQNNAVGMPYLNSYMQGLNRIAQLYVDMMPVIMTTERNLPIQTADGQKSNVFVSSKNPEGLKMSFEPGALHVKVEAGVNFAIQQNRTMLQLERLMKDSPLFGQFMNQDGLGILLDNLSGVRGIEGLKEKAQEFMAQQKAVQAQQQKMQQSMPNPMMMKAQETQKRLQIEEQKLQQSQQELQMKSDQNQKENAIQAANVALKEQQSDNDRLRIMLEAGQNEAERLIKREKMDTEKQHAATDLAIKAASEHAHHTRELKGLEHEILSSQSQNKADRPILSLRKPQQMTQIK